MKEGYGSLLANLRKDVPVKLNTIVEEIKWDRKGVIVETNLLNALKWCDVANMLRVQNERMDLSYFPSVRDYTQQYGLTMPILNQLNKKIVVMHPGPINRGVELTSEVADSSQAIILDQVENGVAIRMAVTYLLASKIKT